MKKVITFGTFDIFHEGHRNILSRAKQLGDILIVGVSSDELSIKKGKNLCWNLEKRITHVKPYADIIFVEESLTEKKNYVIKYGADLLVMGSDWNNAFNWVGIPCVYLPRTEGVSSTILRIEEMSGASFFFYNYNEQFYLLQHYFDKFKIKYQTDKVINENSAIITFDKVQKNPTDKPVIMISNNVSVTDWKIDAENVDYFIVPGKLHKKSIESFTGKTAISSGYIFSEYLFENLKSETLLFAPAYSQDPKVLQEHDIILSIIKKYKHTILYHDQKITKKASLIKTAEIIISDDSNILAMAAAVGKKTIQILMSSYHNNPALPYSLPLITGLSQTFVGGIVTRIEKLDELLKNSISQKIYDMVSFNVLRNMQIYNEAYEKVIHEILKINKKPIHKLNKRNSFCYYELLYIADDVRSLNDIAQCINNGFKILKTYDLKEEEFKKKEFLVYFIIDYIPNNVSVNLIPCIKTLEEYQYLESISYPKCFLDFSDSDYDIDILNYISYGEVEVFGIQLKDVDYNILSCGKRIYTKKLTDNIFGMIADKSFQVPKYITRDYITEKIYFANQNLPKNFSDILVNLEFYIDDNMIVKNIGKLNSHNDMANWDQFQKIKQIQLL